jgi:hypothetical protein
MRYIETQLHGSGDLVDILSTGSRSTDETFLDFGFVKSDTAGNVNHAASVL